MVAVEAVVFTSVPVGAFGPSPPVAGMVVGILASFGAVVTVILRRVVDSLALQPMQPQLVTGFQVAWAVASVPVVMEAIIWG